MTFVNVIGQLAAPPWSCGLLRSSAGLRLRGHILFKWHTYFILMQNNLTIQCEDIVRKTVMLCWIFANFPMLAKLTLPELPQNGVKLVGNSCSFATVCYHFCVAFRKYDGWGVRRGEGILPICCWPNSHLLLLPFGRYQWPASYHLHV